MYQNAATGQEQVANVSFIYNDNTETAGQIHRDISTKLYVKSRELSPVAHLASTNSNMRA